MANHYEVIVVGIGAMGSATLYHLAKRGLNTLGIEQFDIPHEMGSSHGLTRIIRLAYYEDPSYVPLLRRAYQLWHELEGETGQTLLYQTGSLDMGPAESDVFAGSLQSCIEHKLEHEALNSRQLTRRFPGCRMPPETMAVFQPQGGLLMPERCISAYADQAQKLGAALHTRERVQAWHILSDGRLRLHTDASVYTADRLAICGGAWAAKLIPSLADKAVPERQVLIWLAAKEPRWFTPRHFPVWNAMVDEGRFYGFPEFNPGGDAPGVKFGRWHHLNQACDPDALDRDVYQEDEQVLRAFAERYFPAAAGETLNMKVCMFTNTQDEHWLLDTLPNAPQVAVAAGFSGHGFKMASVIGEIMADLAQNGTTKRPIALHQWARL